MIPHLLPYSEAKEMIARIGTSTAALGAPERVAISNIVMKMENAFILRKSDGDKLNEIINKYGI